MINMEQWIEFALRQGAEEAEIFYENTSSNSIKVYEQNVESLLSATAKGIGVRIFINQGMGFAYTSDFSEESLQYVINEAIENAKICPSDSHNGLPQRESYTDIPEIFRSDYQQIDADEKIKLLLDMEKQAKGYHPNIAKVIQTSFADQITDIQLLNSKGFHGAFQSNYCYAGTYVAAQQGSEMQTGGGVTFGRHIDELSLERAVGDACDTALVLLGGQKVRSQKAPVVFNKQVGIMFMYVIANSLYADAVQKGRSLFKDKLGKAVASTNVSLVDDGRYLKGLATSPFDGEGNPSTTTRLIEQGVLRAFMYDTYTARKAGVRSTGNASRSYRSTPSLSTTNFYMENGTVSKEQVIASVKDGFYVMEVSGLVTGGANPITGDFSVGATGRWIKDGQFTTAVREVTIAGNLMSMLEQIDMVANDMEILPIVGSFGCPTFKVNQLAISGS